MNNSPAMEDLVEAVMAGEPHAPDVELPKEIQLAMRAHEALQFALGETLLIPEGEVVHRPPPALSADYEVLGEIGSGGMGVVYLARQKSLNRQVAVKVLRPGEQTFGRLVQRFLHEARHLARLRHPHIVPVHEVGEAQGEPYFTMDYVEGQSLAARLAQGPLPPTQAVALFQQAAEAIQHAHQQGIIHRDLKPANILIDTTGHVFVTDFGLARDLSLDSGMTRSGELLGTPAYMAPEQALGQAELIGESTDLHALGVVLYEMLTGRTPYGMDSPARILARLLRDEPAPLRAIDRRIPRDLETICLKLLHKSPAGRYANVSALREDLRRFEAGEPLMARRPGWASRVVGFAQRRRGILATVTGVVVLMLAVPMLIAQRSYEDLLAWGDEARHSGDYRLAADVYVRALNRSTESQRHDVSIRIAETCRDLDDPKLAVQLAQQVLDVVPDVSFGKYDFLVAQACVAEERQASGGYLATVHGKPSPTLDRAARRLSIFLDGPYGSPSERHEAEQALSAIRAVYRPVQLVPNWSEEDIVRVPMGTESELKVLAGDAARPLWERAKASLALGRLYESRNQPIAARTAFHEAYAMMRQVFPWYSGVSSRSQGSHGRSTAPEAPECRLMREVLEGCQRLDPDRAKTAEGGVRIRLEHGELLGDSFVALNLEACAPEVANPNAGLSQSLSRTIALSSKKPVFAGLVDGRHRLRVSGSIRAFEESGTQLIDIDTSSFPEFVEIQGTTVELVVVVRPLIEVTLKAPADGAALKLGSDALEWLPVEGAVTYQVALSYVSETPTPTRTTFHSVQTDAPRLQFSDLHGRDRDVVVKNLTVGRNLEWQVQALDAQGRRVGETRQPRRALIVTPLDGP